MTHQLGSGMGGGGEGGRGVLLAFTHQPPQHHPRYLSLVRRRSDLWTRKAHWSMSYRRIRFGQHQLRRNNLITDNRRKKEPPFAASATLFGGGRCVEPLHSGRPGPQLVNRQEPVVVSANWPTLFYLQFPFLVFNATVQDGAAFY